MQERLTMALLNGLILAIILIVQLLTVKWSKKDIILGVKIPEGKIDSIEIKDIVKRFKSENLIIGITSLIIIFLTIYLVDSIRFFVISMFIYMGILFLIYLRWHKKVYQLKRKNKWDKLERKKSSKEKGYYDYKTKPESVSTRWFLIPLSIVIFNIFIGLIIYPILPDKLPIHWDMQGNIDGYMDKSFMGILLIPLMQLFLGIIIYLSYLAIKKGKHHTNPRDPKRSLKKNIIFRKVWSAYFIVTLSLVEILLTILNMMTFGLINNIKFFNLFSFIITGLIAVGAIILIMILGQGGDRLKLEEDTKLLKENHMKNESWKLGNIIYFNPKDPTIFIEKRVGIGWTANLGRPLGVVLMAFPIIIIIVALIFAG